MRQLWQDLITKTHPLSAPLDVVIRAIQGKLHLPPFRLRDVGPSDFEATGQEFLHLFIKLAHLQPDEDVLDIGCGCGRMALPLTDYLSQAGSYTGMDIVPATIQWCQQNIARRYSNFQFLHTDLFSRRYNPTGRYQAKDYTFPFTDEHFDFIFLTSVFTHLLPADTENYLRQVARLLRSSGRALLTFFLLNETQQHLAHQNKNQINFKYGSGSYRMRSETIPESAVAYDESFLVKLIGQCGLEMIEPIYYGTWSGCSDGLSYQDIVLVRRRTT
jgi:ubiquinone/menaquinone biosynthesis C-methylase UbiE